MVAQAELAAEIRGAQCMHFFLLVNNQLSASFADTVRADVGAVHEYTCVFVLAQVELANESSGA